MAYDYEDYEPKSVLREIGRLRTLKLLLPAGEGSKRVDRIAAWKNNLASVHYHAATRHIRYLRNPADVDAFLRARLSEGRRPPPYKTYPSRSRAGIGFPKTTCSLGDAAVLRQVLERRRTVREFSRTPTAFGDFAAVVQGTWGQTTWIEGGPLGRLVGKTSPSGGSLHPIECYPLVWNVEGIRPGLYHYEVRHNELTLLRNGRFRSAAVAAASGQDWVGGAAFLCVMTAVFERTLWKYQFENAYRVLWLDAGHLAQTFCLLATARGLGPFTTAAIQDFYIEKLIGLDGIKEFPVYLCGAGVPAKKHS